MIIGINFQFERDRIRVPDCQLPRPLIFFSCDERLALNLIGQPERVARYREWVREGIETCRSHSHFAMIRIPLQYLGVWEATDSILSLFLGTDVDTRLREHVLGLHLTQGALTEWDYYLRLYSLVRKGLTFGLVIDRKKGCGKYREIAEDMSMASWGENILEVRSIWQAVWYLIRELIVPGKTFGLIVDAENYWREEKRWKRLNRLISSKRLWLRLSRV